MSGAVVQRGRATAPRPCASHCRTCGRHFAGDEAFEKHRAGEFEATGFDGRRCRDPELITDRKGNSWFESVVGACRIADSDVQTEIVVWRRRGSADRFKGNARLKAGRP